MTKKFITLDYQKGPCSAGRTCAPPVIHQWSDSGADNQRFYLGKDAGNNYMLVNKHSGKCMDVDSSGTADGTNIRQYWCNGTGAQRFTFVPVPTSTPPVTVSAMTAAGKSQATGLAGRYTIKSVNSNLCMDVSGAGTGNGVNIQQYGCNKTAAQSFDLVSNGGYYNLKNVNSGKMVDVAGVSKGDGANIQQWVGNNGDNQRFSFVDKGNGQYEIHAKHSGKCVDVAGWSTTNGGNVQQWSCGNSQANQKWILSPIN